MGPDAANTEHDGELEADPFLERNEAPRTEVSKVDPLVPPSPPHDPKDRQPSEGDACRAPYKTKALIAQLMVAGGVFLLGISAGFPIGFSAVLLPQLQAPNSTLPTDDDMGSWIASIHSAATPVGSLFSGMLADRFGRRLTLQLAAVPYIVGWVVMAFADSHAVIIAARVVCGLAVGLTAAPAQIILGEVAEPRVRGMLSGTPFISYSLGILLVYALGAYLDWRLASWLAIIIPTAALLVFCFLPESPVWLTRNNRVERAHQSLVWLRGGDTVKARRELAELMRQLPADDGRRSSLLNMASSQNSIGLAGSQKIISSIKNITRPRILGAYLEPSILKPFLIVTLFGLSQVICGTYMVIFYAVDLVSKAGPADDMEQPPPFDPFAMAVLTAVIRLVFVCVASGLLFRVGRRTLALTSGVTSATTALGLGALLCTAEPSAWVVATLLQVFVATNTLGFFILPGMSIGELLPASIRGSAGGFIFMLFNACLFGMAKVFPAMSYQLGGHGLFWFFGTSTILTTVFLYLVLPETRGKTLQEVEDYFKQDNILWTRSSKQKSADTPIKTMSEC